MEKHEPSLEVPTAGDEAAPARAAGGPARSSPAGAHPSAAPARPKGPPQEPEAFRRWVDIERLKVDMRRLEIENRRMELEAQRPAAPRSTHPVLAAFFGAVAALLIALPALGLYQMMTLRNDLTALRAEVGELRAAIAAVDDKVALSADAAPAPVAALPQGGPAPSTPPAGNTPPATASAPAPAAAPPQETAAAAPPKPAGLGSGYIVRMFAPTGSVPAAKIDQFTGILKGVGFEVLVSDAGVSNPTSNTLSYNAASTDIANKLATLVQSKRPALDLELRSSPSIPDSAKQILILNMTEDALR